MTTQEKTLKARSDTLRQYVSDMVAVEEDIGMAVKRQTEDKSVSTINPQADQIIQRIARQTEQHVQRLKQHLEAIGHDPAKGIIEVATAAMGAVAGMYDKVRSEKVSKMLRDDYTALNLAAVGYTMLHTTGLAVQDPATAGLALRHLRNYTSIIMELNQIIPSVVVAELKDNSVILIEGSVQQAVLNTQDAWIPPSNGNGNPSI
jgi:ferritin-like metal-binding protein YciE